MPIFYPDILDERQGPQTFSYTEKDVMLYALGIGMGRDPLDERELAFVYEKDLRVVPTAVTVLAPAASQDPAAVPILPPGRRASSINLQMVVHGEQKVELHQPLPCAGTFTAERRTIAAYDKGEGKGAVLVYETSWTDGAGARVATLTSSIFARGDGGFGGPREGQPEPHRVPAREPDASIDIETRPDQALLYRLNGDRNPLHAEPAFATAAGFPVPILHGLCTYGIACRAVLSACADFDPGRIRSHQARFSAPVYPGDVITVDLWRDGDIVSFEARVKARGITAIRNGMALIGAV